MKKNILLLCILLLCSLLMYKKVVFASTTNIEVEGTDIIPCINGNFFVEKDGKFALYNRGGLLKTDFLYDDLNSDIDARTMNENIELFLAIKDNKWGMIDSNGNEVLPFIYDYLRGGVDYDGLIRYSLGGKVGLFYPNGKVLVEPKYDAIYPIVKNLFKVELDGKFGIIDRNGIEIIKIQCEELDLLGDELIPLKQNGKCGVYSISKGEMIFDFQYDSINFAYVNIDKSKAEFDLLIIVSVSGKYGIINKEGDIIAPLIYDKIERHSFEFKNKMDNVFIIEQNGKFGVINWNGKIIVKPQYDRIVGCGEGLVAVSKNYYYGVLDSKGKIVADIVYNDIADINQGYIVVKYKDKYGVLSKKGKLVIPFKYEYARIASNSSIIVKRKGKYGIVDNKNNILVKIDNEYIYEIAESTGLFKIKRNGKIGIITDKGKIIVKPLYESLNYDIGYVDEILKSYYLCFGENSYSYNIAKKYLDLLEEGITALNKNKMVFYGKNLKISFESEGDYKRAFFYNNLLYYVKNDNKVGWKKVR